MYEDIAVEKDGWVAKVTLRRAAKMNSLTERMKNELYRAFDEIDADPTVRVLIVTGEGKAFCSGWFMGTHSEEDRDGEDLRLLTAPETLTRAEMYVQSRRFLLKGRNLFLKLWDLRQPVITAVNGPALAAGCNLALAGDIAIASEDAVFGEPEIRQGSGSPLLVIPWLTGARHAHEILLTGDSIDAHEAYRIGLVNKVVPADKLQETAQALALRIAKVGAVAAQQTKRSLKQAYEIMGFKAALDANTANKHLLFLQPDEDHAELRRVMMSQGSKAMVALRDSAFND